MLRSLALLCLLVLVSCDDPAEPPAVVVTTSLRPGYTPGDEVAIVITNVSGSDVFVAEYSELEFRDGTSWRVLSVSGCELGPPGWHVLHAGGSNTCRHPTALTYPAGEYRLQLAVARDTTMHRALTPSVVFRITYDIPAGL